MAIDQPQRKGCVMRAARVVTGIGVAVAAAICGPAAPARADVPAGWAPEGKPTNLKSQVDADRRFAAAQCGANSVLLLRVRGSGEKPGEDFLGRWTFEAGTALIQKGWVVRDMQAIYSAPGVPLSEVAAAAFTTR